MSQIERLSSVQFVNEQPNILTMYTQYYQQVPCLTWCIVSFETINFSLRLILRYKSGNEPVHVNKAFWLRVS